MPACDGTRKGATGAFFLALALLLPTLGEAQVYRCSVAGKTVYQASPCTSGAGKSLNLPSGPNEQDIKDARARAETEKARATAPATPAPKPADAPQPPAASSSCNDLYRQHAQLVQDRNNAVRLERKFGGGGSVVQGRDILAERFERLEAQMRQANCPLPD